MQDRYEKLKHAAQNALSASYSPYSNVKIGAAVLCDNGHIYTGTNVENASYGATICAERCAIVKAISENEQSFIAIAVTGDIDDYAYPCGICRQVMNEFMKKDAYVFVSGKNLEWKQFTLNEMLPHSFDYFENKKGT